MASIPSQLADVHKQVQAGKKPSATVRQFISWYSAQRRGRYVVWLIRQSLKMAKLATVPDFENEYIDGTIHFVALEDPKPTAKTATTAIPEVPPPTTTVTTTDGTTAPVASLVRQDPAYRVRKLEAANRAPTSVTPDKSITEAITVMLTRDFSQLPVMQGERKVIGLFSWKSLGSRLALRKECKKVSDAMEPVTMVTSDASIFQVADILAKHEVVLVQASATDPKVTGILTSTDLAMQFGQLGEPFLLLGEIENHVRELLDGKFTAGELGELRDPGDGAREVGHVSDLTVGEYVRLLEKPERWEKCLPDIDRSVFIHELKRVRDIRNDVMHFDPEPITPDELDHLRRFAGFLQRLNKLGSAG